VAVVVADLAVVSPSPGQTAPATNPTAATAPAAATQPAATQPADDIRLNFKDMPLNTVLEHLSQAAGFVVVKEAPVDGRVTVLSMGPVTANEAVALLDTVLKANGFTAIREGRTLRIVARDKAKKGNLPVHVGADPAAIAATDELITQVIPVHNVDATKLRQDLMPLLGPDADVTANGGANALVITDASANIRRVVQIVATLDRRDGTAAELKIVPLKNAAAAAAVRMIQSIFPEPKTAAPAPNQPQPPPKARDEKALGGGVEQALLHGAKVTAAADERTNSVVIAGPAETVKLVENLLKELDANPATVLSVKSFRLKVSDAPAVAKLLTAMFADAAPASQVRVATNQPLQARVTAVAEDRTNTLVVTAPEAAMKVVEEVIKDLEQASPTDGNIRSYRLKYAEAANVVKVLTSVFLEGQPAAAAKAGAPGLLGRMNATADARTNTVLVTGSPEALRSVDKMIQDLDASPTSGSQVRFFHLKQADAPSAAKMIAKFFKPEGGAAPPAGGGPGPQFGVTADADDRSNTVVVSAPAEAMAVVEAIVKEIETDPLTALDIRSFTLRYADAAATAALLTSVFQPDTSQGASPGTKVQAPRTKVVAAADPRTNSVVVTAQADALALVEGIIKLLDSGPMPGPDMKLFQLRYADATDAAKLVQSVFGPAPQQGGGGGSSGQGDRSKDAKGAVQRGVVSANVDERTNTLVLSGAPEALSAAEALVRHIDSNPTTEEVVFMYRLRNGQSLRVAQVLNELFGNVAQGAGATAGGILPGSPLASIAQAGALNLSDQRGGARRSLSQASPGGLGGGTGIGARRGTVSVGGPGTVAAAQLPAGVARAVTELTGQVFVVAHPDTNSLLVSTAARFEKQVRQIIVELDRPVPQVLIKVLVAEVTHDNSMDIGAEFSILNLNDNGVAEVSAGTDFNLARQTNGAVVKIARKEFNATLRALENVGKLDVLSRPYILASDNQLASITVGQEVPFVTNTRITDQGQTLNTIQYQDVGIILNVTPHINPEGLVILDVSPEISQLTGTTVTVSEGVDAPVIAKRSAESRVGVKDGQTVVIGGLMEDRKTSTVQKVPILGDLPLVGAAFRRTQWTKAKTELLIFLTPHVAQQPQTLGPMTDEEMRGTRLTPRAVAPGVFDEHLGGMRRGEVPQTRPATQPEEPVVQFEPAPPPTTAPGPDTQPSTIHLPGR
jgi:general secretion pathway protein D